jgi:hypothetical protein
MGKEPKNVTEQDISCHIHWKLSKVFALDSISEKDGGLPPVTSEKVRVLFFIKPRVADCFMTLLKRLYAIPMHRTHGRARTVKKQGSLNLIHLTSFQKYPKRRVVRFAHNRNTGMLEYWNNGIYDIRSVFYKFEVLSRFLSQPSFIPSFHGSIE